MARLPTIRGLRLAFTSVFGMFCVLCTALWLRSYWRWDTIFRAEANYQGTTLGSNFGTVYLHNAKSPFAESQGWTHKSDKALRTPVKLRWRSLGDVTVVIVPSWMPVAITAALAAAPWMKPRFKLRTFLLAFTIVAVVVALTVWAL
jgi:hypothetical protein